MVQNNLKKLNQSIVKARDVAENFSEPSHRNRPEPHCHGLTPVSN